MQLKAQESCCLHSKKSLSFLILMVDVVIMPNRITKPTDILIASLGDYRKSFHSQFKY